MNITKDQKGDKLTIKLEGRLDTITSPNLESELSNVGNDINTIVLDLEKLEYISSSGLRVVLALHKKMSDPKKLIVKNFNDNVKEILDITGFLDILNIENK